MEKEKSLLSKMLPHVVAVVLFLVISYAYFSTQIEGKKIKSHDGLTFLGMSKEILDYKEETGETTLWTNSMFGGMPAYLISVKYSSNLIRAFIVGINKTLGRPANFLFFSLLGFYIALLIFRVNPWLALGGAVAYAFSTYFLIILDAGHTSKANALGYMAPIIASIYLAYNRKLLLGAILATLFLSIQIFFNHLQITYYTMLIVLVFLIFQFVNDLKEHRVLNFFKASGLLVVGSIIALGINFTAIYYVNDYGKDSIRGESELTLNEENQTSGLDKDYALAWSYGNWETFTLFVPSFHGGGSGADYENTEFYNEYYQNIVDNMQRQGYTRKEAREVAQQQISQPFYWGTQPGTSGPVYIGAIVVFLFILGLFLVKGRLKWWLLVVTVLSILLAWGKNFMFLSDLFLDYFPGYNKFRTVSMILVIAEFAMPLLGILALQKIVEGGLDKKKVKKALYWSAGIVGGLCLLFAIMPTAFVDFGGANDDYYSKQGILDTILSDRKAMFQNDAFRSFMFIAVATVLLFIYQTGKLKKNLFYLIIGVLFLLDMMPINKRYLNENDFISKREVEKPFIATQADNFILQDKDPHYRVFNSTVSTFNDASTSYFHKSIGGYHGAKMRRFQEVIEHQIAKNNMGVLNMLNTKYIIVADQKTNAPIPQQNPEALGNAWFVDNYKIVKNADEEIVALTDLKPKQETVIDKRFSDKVEGFKIQKDSTASIKLTEYKPNYLAYESNANSEQLAVFSEIYYAKGWNAYIDGKLVPHFRANYILRAMRIPEGKHKIEYKFEPAIFKTANTVSLASSLILIFLFIGIVTKEILDSRKK